MRYKMYRMRIAAGYIKKTKKNNYEICIRKIINYMLPIIKKTKRKGCLSSYDIVYSRLLTSLVCRKLELCKLNSLKPLNTL